MNTILNAVISAGITIIVAVIGVLGAGLKGVLEKKKEEIATRVGIQKYNDKLNTARQLFNVVNETFRITPTLEKTFENKAAEFDKLMKAKIPYLTDDEIASLRQTVAAEFNKDKAVVTSGAVEQQTEFNAVKAENEQLKATNTELSQKLCTIQNAIK